MHLNNRTGFPAVTFRQFDRVGGYDAVIAVRGTFMAAPGILQAAPGQEPLLWEDQTEADMLLQPNDLVPFKPGTDITALGVAQCPDPAGARSWLCGLTISDQSGSALVKKQLRVTGPRQWRPRLRTRWQTLLGIAATPILLGWDLTAPGVAQTVSLDWSLAQGGALPDEPGDVDWDNPAGLGIMGRNGPDPGRPWPAPQIEAMDTPIADWQAAPAPAGLGPVAPWWRQRARYGGSGQLVWLDEHRPVLPPDFDERYWQCAPPDQVVTPWLRGYERFELRNLHADHPVLAGSLPGIILGAAVQPRDGPATRVPLNLDGVHFDLRPGRDVVTLTWRARFPMPMRQGTRITLTERTRLSA